MTLGAESGQYLTLRIPTNEGDILRCYSISSDVTDSSAYRISVKREIKTDSSIGVGSSWLHDRAKVGGTIEVAPPRGRFILNSVSSRPVLLLSADVGLMPLVSMLHSLQYLSNDVLYIHTCANSDVHAFREEIGFISERSKGRIRTHYIYRHPTKKDHELSRFDSQEAVNKELIQSLYPINDYDLYLCGPNYFMKDMIELFQEIGLSSDRMFCEFFDETDDFDLLKLTQRDTSNSPVPSQKVELI